MRHAALLLTLATALSWSAVARAGAPETPPAAAEPDPGTWYGWQLMIPDALSLGLLTCGYVQRDFGPALYGGLGFVLVPPLLHLLHGRPQAAGMSLVYRLLGAPAAFLFVLQVSALLKNVTCPTERACQNVAAGIAGAGLLGAALADAGEAYGPRPPAPVVVPVLSGTW